MVAMGQGINGLIVAVVVVVVFSDPEMASEEAAKAMAFDRLQL